MAEKLAVYDRVLIKPDGVIHLLNDYMWTLCDAGVDEIEDVIGSFNDGKRLCSICVEIFEDMKQSEES